MMSLSLSASLIFLLPLLAWALDFNYVSTAPFSPRSWPYLGRVPQTNTFLLWGAADYTQNDVWRSTDKGITWELIAGVGSTGSAPGASANTSFRAYQGPATAIDQAGRMFRVSGEMGNNLGCSSDIWWSSNGQQWNVIVVENSFTPRIYGHLTVDRANNLYLIGGRTCATSISQWDVWMSTNQGRGWTRQTAVLPVGGPRNAVVHMHYSSVLNRDIITHINGWDGSTDYNDVWVSSNGGVQWELITLSAPWQQRDDGAGIVSATGVFVLVGGKTQASPEIFHNDIWASLDGGWSWGRCIEDARFSDRRYLGLQLDSDGYLYVAAGQSNEGTNRNLNDVWKSSISFNDAAAVSRECGVPVPQCGRIGLSCFPGAGTVRLPRGVSCSACPTAEENVLDFVQQSLSAPWSPRRLGNIESYPKAITYRPLGSTTTVTVPAGALVMQGNDNWSENDVWISSDHGRTWSLVAGVSRQGRSGVVSASSPFDASSFATDTAYSAFTMDPRTGALYRIGGYFPSACANIVQVSTNGATWSQANEDPAPFISPLREYAAAVVDSTGAIVLTGGRQCHSDGQGLTDTWLSTTQGRTWTRQAASAPWDRKVAHLMLTHKGNAAALSGKDVIFVLGGWTGSLDSNDIWATTDRGVSWHAITLHAQWDRRDDMNGEVTAAGLMIISGGKQDNSDGTQEFFNDVWVSADGGYSWGACITDAAFSDRRYQMTVLDADGFLIVAAGQNVNMTLLNDVYRSTFSFNDLPRVSLACNIRIPSCGVGLYCLPNSPGFRRLPGNHGVSCNACPASYTPTAVDFLRMNGGAPWSGRSSGNMEQINKQITYTNLTGSRITIKSGAIVLHGNDNYQENDVWLSTDKGSTWSLIAGVSRFGRSGVVQASGGQNSFTPDASGAAFTLDKDFNMYRISGSPSSSAAECQLAVWQSRNGGVNWNDRLASPVSRRKFGPARELATAIWDSNGNIYLAGGRPCTGWAGLNDVWMSSDQGTNWQLQTARAPWHARLVHQMLNVHSPVLNKEILVLMSGWLGDIGRDTNDVWASQDQGRTWSKLGNAQWSNRDDANAEVTAKGVIILTAGKSETPNGQGGFDTEVLNDVWASLDGGYTWGLCNRDAAFSDRRYQMTMLDNEGYMYVAAGNSADSANLNDVYRSVDSFDNLAVVTSLCGIKVPSCGVGLNCWPTSSGFRILNNGYGATCTACSNYEPWSGISSSSSTGPSGGGESGGSTTLKIVGGIAAVLAVLGAAYCARRYWQSLDAKQENDSMNESLVATTSSNELTDTARTSADLGSQRV